MSRGFARVTADGMPIATRLRRLVLATWVLILLVSGVSVLALRVQSQRVEGLTLIAQAADANNVALLAMGDAEAALLDYGSNHDVALQTTYGVAADHASVALRTVRQALARTAEFDPDQSQHVALVSRQETALTAWRLYAARTEQAVVTAKTASAVDGRVAFEQFRVANAELGGHIRDERNLARASLARLASRQELIVVAVCLLAMLLGLVGGSRAARAFSRPIGELRSVLRRQREGDLSARARVDKGSSELRSLARDLNALTEQHLGLLEYQARGLGMNKLTFELARAIRAAPDIQAVLNVLCSELGPGLGVDRVMANTVSAQHQVLLGAQWHLPDLLPLGDVPDAMLPQVGELAEELWLSSQHLTMNDLLSADVAPEERARARIFHAETGARALMVIPIGLGERVIGMIYVITVTHPRAWSEAEANTVQQVAGFVARAVVQTDHLLQQSEYVERLVQLDRQKSDFLATVSHELRTPLTSISGYLEMLQDRDAGELTVEQARMLEVMDRNTNRLGGLIEDLLVLNRIESGELKAGVQVVSIRDLIVHAGHELSPFAQRAAVELDYETGPDAVTVLGHKGSLDRAVINVVSNAIKFSRPGGVVTIRCRLDEGARRVLISCRDRGVGIPSEDQPHLFTRFFRATNAVAQEIPGTGLGLSIVKQIVEDHHGALRLSSVEGEGTEVVIDLPLSTAAPDPVDDAGDQRFREAFGIPFAPLSGL